MKNKIIKFLVFFLFLFSPNLVLANRDVVSGLNFIKNLFSFGGISGSQTLTGPSGLIYRVLSLMLFIAGALAVVFVVIGGYQYITSAGNEEQSEKGKKTLVNAIIGIVVIVLSFTIINVVVNTVSGSGSTFGF
jgi:hypothetical protein